MIDLEELRFTLAGEIACLNRLKKELAALPPESLHIKRRNGRLLYSTYTNGVEGKRQERYLPASDEASLRAHLRARYLRRLVPALSSEVRALQQFIAHYTPEKKLLAWDSIPEDCQNLVTCEFRDNRSVCEGWAHQTYESNPYKNDAGSTYLTKCAVPVRSKIELISADIITDLSLFYRYECKLLLADGCIYPDFTIIHPVTLELYYVEIFGMMDHADYATAAYRKIQRYAENGLAAHLITFFHHQNAPLSTQAIRTTLSSIFTAKQRI